MTPFKKIDIVLIVIFIMTCAYVIYNIGWVIDISRKVNKTKNTIAKKHLSILKHKCVCDLIESLSFPIIMLLWKWILWGINE